MRIHLALTPAHVFLCAMVIFVVYGSLFPFDFQPADKPGAELFRDWHPFINRADAIDNILLFVPLGLTLHFCFDSQAARWRAGLLAWLVLGLGLQWAQMFVPGRVASFADAINNATGLIVGLVVARLIAPWLERQKLLNPSGDLFALLLVAAWYSYESFPFLPTLDVGLLRGHIKSAFEATGFDASRMIRHVIAATLGGMLLLRADILRSRWTAIASAAGLILLSEIFVPYGGLRGETLLGIVVGLAVGERLDRWFGGQSHRLILPLALVALAITVATPFRNQPAGEGFTLTPFSGLLWHGKTSGIPPTAFEALAIGALLWSGLPRVPNANAVSRHWPLAVGAILIVAELLRVRVMGYRGDTTIFVVWAILAPIAVMTKRPRSTVKSVTARPTSPIKATASVQSTTHGVDALVSSNDTLLRIALNAAIGLICMTIGLWLVLRLPTIPYNVKELFGSSSWLAMALFSLALLWLGYGPWWVTMVAARARAAALWLPVLLFAASMISLLLLTFSVTQESLDDITGSPDLYRRITQDEVWGTAWRDWMSKWPAGPIQAAERAVRYSALYGLLLIPLSVAAMQLCRRWPVRKKLTVFVAAAIVWWLAKIVVIDWAITDNLTELIAPGGVPWLALVLMMFTANVATLLVLASGRGTVAAAAITAFFMPATWWLVTQGLEPVLIKYGLVFSAVQFLLGQSRGAQLGDWQLLFRWCILYLAAASVIAWGMRLGSRFMAIRTGAVR